MKTARLLIPAVDELRHFLRHQLEARLNCNHDIIVVHLESFLRTAHTYKLRRKLLLAISHITGLQHTDHYVHTQDFSSNSPVLSGSTSVIFVLVYFFVLVFVFVLPIIFSF